MNLLCPVFCIYFILCTLVFVNFVNNASVVGRYQKFVGDQGLYKAHDDVEILTVGNFRNAVFGSEQAWVVEFYNSYCGFCQMFAPHWKKFATNVKHWQDLVKVAAIDCAVEVNTGLCREFEVMGYPNLRYFHENFSSKKAYGDKLRRSTTEEAHINDLLDKILNEQLEGRAKQFPTLQLYNFTDTSQIVNMISKENSKATYGALVIQEPTSYLGMEVAMDLHRLPEILVRYAHSNNTQLVNSLGSTSVPAVFIINKDTAAKQVTPVQNDRVGVVKSIVDELKLYSKYNDIVLNGDKKNLDAQRDHENKNTPDKLIDKVKKMGDAVYQMDLETALRYSLKREVGGTKVISEDKLEALRKYLEVLEMYFPFGINGKMFLSKIYQYILTSSPVEGKRIFEMVKAAEAEEEAVFSTSQNWLGCRGSQPHFRGYPCGLWKMFHYLVINAAEENEFRDKNPRVALQAMHGYIKNFFGCTDCAQHFQDMAKRRELEKVASFNDSILWLWMAHNEVNNRLHGEITEDPEFPKVQFPAKEKCPKCYKQDGTFNTTEVLNYLKHMYSSVNVNYLGADISLTRPELVHEESIIESITTSSGVVKPLEMRANNTSGSSATIKDKELSLFILLLCGGKVLTFLHGLVY